MSFNIILLIISIIFLQLIVGHFFHSIGFKLSLSLLLTCLPFGIGVFLMQLCYFERRYPHWEVPYRTKLRLKYLYIATFFEFIMLYICLFLIA